MSRRNVWIVTAAISLGALQCAAIAQQVNTTDHAAENRLERLEASLADANRAKDVAELKAQISDDRQAILDSAYARLEVLMGIFALLITILVLVFGFRTEKAAARAAQGEVADRKKELDEIINQSRAAAEAATAASGAAEQASETATSHAKSAADHAAMARVGAQAARAATVAPSEETMTGNVELTDLKRAQETPQADRTPSDYRALIRSAISNAEWDNALRLSREMQINGVKNKSDYYYSLGQESFALGEVDELSSAIANCSKIIEMHDASDDDGLREDVATAYFNRGLYKGMLNNDYTIDEDFDTVIELFANDTYEGTREIVTKAHLQKAVAFAEADKVTATINALNKWEDFRGGFDCNAVVESIFFKDLLHRPQFAKFLSGKGCDIPESESD